MKITSLADIEQVEKDYPLNELIPFDSTYAAIRATADHKPTKTALSFFLSAEHHQHAVNISYRELINKITQTANLFHHLGLAENDVVAFLLPNLPETHYVVCRCFMSTVR
ncbi:MAG: fatty-acyl-CoA synthase [Phenylobacterium sp.]|jgi:fatty-acyl-CoA synthase